VIEASDVGNLLDQFEADERVHEEPERRRQIAAAVRGHYAKAPRKFPAGKAPKLGDFYVRLFFKEDNQRYNEPILKSHLKWLITGIDWDK